MDIIFTNEAKQQLSNQKIENLEYLCLIYEVGGCDSPFDGIIHMYFSKTIPKNYVLTSTNWINVHVEKYTLSILEENLTVDYKSNRFIIISNSQIYNVYKD